VGARPQRLVSAVDAGPERIRDDLGDRHGLLRLSPVSRAGSRLARVALALATLVAIVALTAVGLGVALDLSAEELLDLAVRELSDPFAGGGKKRKSPMTASTSPYVVPSPGLRNCRLELTALGDNQVSFGSIDGRPGHFLAILRGGDRVKVAVACPVRGKVEPAAERSESTTFADRFSWDVRPTVSSTTFGIRWLHPTGSQDEITIHWEVR
jgi:hypothetical protein